MPLTAADVAKQKQEAERQAVERFKASITAKLEEMKQASPSEAESIHGALKQYCTDKRLSLDFKNFVMKRARHYECESNMRATTKAMNEAVDYARAEKLKERSARLAMARQWFGKACSLGAGDEFRRATERLIETAMMTGGVYKPGVATRAKPVDTAPKNPNDAKAMPPPEKEGSKGAKPEGDKPVGTDISKVAVSVPKTADQHGAKAPNWSSAKW